VARKSVPPFPLAYRQGNRPLTAHRADAQARGEGGARGGDERQGGGRERGEARKGERADRARPAVPG
jgi:hypothetical protein